MCCSSIYVSLVYIVALKVTLKSRAQQIAWILYVRIIFTTKIQLNRLDILWGIQCVRAWWRSSMRPNYRGRIIILNDTLSHLDYYFIITLNKATYLSAWIGECVIIYQRQSEAACRITLGVMAYQYVYLLMFSDVLHRHWENFQQDSHEGRG